MTAWINDDVIGRPGQNLSTLELGVLVAMANGNSQRDIQEATKTDSATLRMVELQVRAKLGAKTPSHMIARAFTLGVLIPHALCLVLCLMSAIEIDQDFTRPRSQRRTRTFTEHSRNCRGASVASSGGLPHQINIAS